MNLPEGIKHAVSMGANEVFIEWLDAIAEDPESVLDDLGTTYQGVMTPELISETDARRMIGELGAWNSAPTPTGHGALVTRLQELQVSAGIDFAKAMIALALGNDDVPDRVKPYEDELAPLVSELKQALADGSFDEDAFDIQGVIWS
jgi:hypothetical protein